MNTWLGNVVSLRSPTGFRAFCCACIVATAWLTWPDSARAQGDFYVQNGSAVNFTLLVKDALQHPLPNLTVRVYEESDVAVGGHNHPVQSPGGALFRLGRFSPRSCNTGYNGQMCQMRMDAGNVGGTLRLLADVVNGPVFYLPQQFHIGAYGGFDIPYRLENFGSSDFISVGQTATHPDNHYCQPDFCFGVLQLAQNYPRSGVWCSPTTMRPFEGAAYSMSKETSSRHTPSTAPDTTSTFERPELHPVRQQHSNMVRLARDRAVWTGTVARISGNRQRALSHSRVVAMSNKQSILGVICVTLLIPAHAFGQKPASVTALQDPPRIETFTKTTTGDWQTAIRTPDGLTREYVYSPPNKVAPVVDVHVDVAERGGGVRLIYRYRVENQASALQELAWLWIGSVQPSLVHEVPPGWRNVSPQHPGTMSFYGPPNGKYLAGIPPGDSGMFTLEAAALPGVVTLRAMGHTGGAVEIPEGLTPRQRQDLLKLSENVTVNSPTIGPAIPAGLGAPELTFDVVLARVGAHYVEQMEIYGHPEAAAVRKVVEQIVRPGAQLADPVVRKGLERLGDIASRQTADSWHRELSRALAVTIRVLSSGAVPIKE